MELHSIDSDDCEKNDRAKYHTPNRAKYHAPKVITIDVGGTEGNGGAGFDFASESSF